MPLVRLIYSSVKKDFVEIDDIRKILETARANNKRNNITGMLCFNSDYFLQAIEGERSKVCELLNNISKDERHNNILLYQFIEVNKREFDNWSMGYVPESSLTASVIFKYSNSTLFNPPDMSSESLLEMMLFLKEVVPTE